MPYFTFTAAVGNSLYQLLVVQAFRPDRVLAMVHKVVETVFGQTFLRASEHELDLAFIVEKEVQYCDVFQLHIV
jgi:dynein heavy chain 1